MFEPIIDREDDEQQELDTGFIDLGDDD